MALSKIKKIGILGLKKDEKNIIESVYNFGLAEVISKNNQENYINEELSNIDYQISQIKFAINFIIKNNKINKKKNISLKNKLISLVNPFIKVKEKEIERIVRDFDYKFIIKKAEELEDKINHIKNNIDKLNKETKELLLWNELSFNYQEINNSEFFGCKIGILNKDNLEKLRKKPLINVDEIKNKDKKNVFVSIIFKKENAVKINDYLSEAVLNEVTLPVIFETTSNTIKKNNLEVKKIKEKLELLFKNIEGLSKYEYKLKIIFDFLNWERDKILIKSKHFDSNKTFYLKIWIDENEIDNLKKYIVKNINKIDFEFEEISLDKNEYPPVILKNNRLVEPFENITKVYGLPHYYELDPTPFLAPFFIIFFGLSLGDAGYGIILMLLSIFSLYILKIKGSIRSMLRLVFYGGLSTFIAGILTGSYFGISIELLPEIFSKFKILDPINNPIFLLLISLILGIIQIVYGIGINAYYRFKIKDWQKFLDAMLWLFFVSSILFWIVLKSDLVKYIIYAGAVALILTQGRDKKNIILKFFSGIISLYGLVGYLSDVLSYSRLLALGLSTGIIAIVINLLAGLSIDMLPIIGIPVAILILIIGHLFNLIINILGAFIHSSRLQFVEFFPKFMQGGGGRFKPSKAENKYIEVIKNIE